MDILLYLFLILLIIYLLRRWIARAFASMLMRRMQRQFDAQRQSHKANRRNKTKKQKTLSMEEVERRKFDKDHGEYVDFTEEHHPE